MTDRSENVGARSHPFSLDEMLDDQPRIFNGSFNTGVFHSKMRVEKPQADGFSLMGIESLIGGDWNIWILFPIILGIITIPTDELHHFSEG